MGLKARLSILGETSTSTVLGRVKELVEDHTELSAARFPELYDTPNSLHLTPCKRCDTQGVVKRNALSHAKAIAFSLAL